jgi:glutathione peroxidase
MEIYDFEVKDLQGNSTTLAPYRGKVLLIVNVASQCGFTPQYEGLESVYRELKGKGFEVLGFPCNQFGSQEPGTESDIKTFCETRFHVSFPMFSKIDVNGESAHPLYNHLKSHAKGVLGSEAVKWNFTKFLVDGLGRVVKRYASTTKPEAIKGDIEALLTTSPK